MKIKVPISAPGLPGYHSVDYPHAVNQLLLDRLGDHEVVLVACDDGDVVAYYVKDVQYAIDNGTRKIQRDGQWDHRPVHLRPILHENVGMSAWGLAVHREARLIAVSANTREITIYSFALTGADGHSSPKWGGHNTVFDSQSGCTTGPNSPYYREIGRRKILRTDAVPSNIPNISFCNTPEDPRGRYLASTNIVGVTTIWDLEHDCSVEDLVMRTRSPGGSFEPWNFRFSERHGGWNVLFLDKRSFRTAETETRIIPNLFWDVNTRDGHRESWVEQGIEAEDTEVFDSEGGDAMNGTENEDDDLYQGPETSQSSDDEYPPVTSNFSSSLGLFVRDRPSRFETVNDRSQFWMSVLSDCRAGELSPLPHCPVLCTSTRDVFLLQPEYTTFGRSRFVYKSDSEKPSEVIANRTAAGLGPVLSFDFSSQLPQPFCPIQILHNPLRESFAFSSFFPQCERLNMVNEVPELGIVVVGCGKGRAAIIQLIKHSVQSPRHSPKTDNMRLKIRPRKQFKPSEESLLMDCSPNQKLGGRRDARNSPPSGQNRKLHRQSSQIQEDQSAAVQLRNHEIYTFRLAHKIPFEEQEQSRERPPIPLAGMAVGPIQGSTQRWRVLLTYLDGTILTYELCRERNKGDRAAGVPEILV
ncbi:hypothetical protein EV356DRAFT_536287 [Viridothelium virens]|uniref:Uncharacterized protein n=1 Tax=Viridothelium virens TaxID=1048519 RepID=A0A6A6GYZ5_VIRVR|nr:hypothetical protein EV356DRAFT_536287 [Viridothelium virens]